MLLNTKWKHERFVFTIENFKISLAIDSHPEKCGLRWLVPKQYCLCRFLFSLAATRIEFLAITPPCAIETPARSSVPHRFWWPATGAVEWHDSSCCHVLHSRLIPTLQRSNISKLLPSKRVLHRRFFRCSFPSEASDGCDPQEIVNRPERIDKCKARTRCELYDGRCKNDERSNTMYLCCQPRQKWWYKCIFFCIK